MPARCSSLMLPLPLISLLGACGAGTAAEAIRPKESTAAAALGQGECADVGSGAEPLIVDWKPEQRGDLEVAMKDGVAVVGYSCEGIKLLTECKLEGKYGYIGITRKEQVLKLESSDELKANLPLTGSQISASLDRGSSLDVAMIMVGKKRTTWSGPTLADLKGECGGATHYVRGATVGAFALATGTRANVRASAQIFAAGTEGASHSGKELRNRDGDPAECEKANPDSEAPPAQCGAPLRLVLVPVAKNALQPASGEPPAAEAAAGPVEPAAAACPTGLVESGGKCTKPDSAAAFQCQPGETAVCKQQCDKGHPGSCRALAEISFRDGTSAAPAAKKACDGGDARGCSLLGELLRKGSGVPKDEAAASKAFEQACSGGDGSGCTALGRALPPAEAERALGLFERGCKAADVAACAAAGAAYLGATASTKRQVQKARELLSKACDGGDAASCGSLGTLYDMGDPQLPRQPIFAEMSYRRGCMRGSTEACTGLGKALLSKPGGDTTGEAKRHLERGCMGRDALACAALKVLFGDARPVMLDVKQRMLLSSTCVTGSSRSCADLALLDAASGNLPAAKPNLQRACTMGDAWGCLIQNKVGK